MTFDHFKKSHRSQWQIVAMMAALMALYASGIDLVIPAMLPIQSELSITGGSSVQYMIPAFVAGGGCGQLFMGALSDAIGRRPVALISTALFAVLSFISGCANSIEMLLIARFLQGAGAAGMNILPLSIIRDRYAGAEMARITSFIMAVFITVSTAAPILGQATLHFLSWRSLFVALGIVSLILEALIYLHLPETNTNIGIEKINFKYYLYNFKKIASNTSAALYTMAATLMLGSLLIYINMIPQLFVGPLSAPDLMGVTYTFCASLMALGAVLNGTLVRMFGTRRLSQTALVAYTFINLGHWGVAYVLGEGLILFAVLQASALACFSLTVSNFTAIAMEDMKSSAGSAAALQGMVSMLGSAFLATGASYLRDGSLYFLPFCAACCGGLALLLVLIARSKRPEART